MKELKNISSRENEKIKELIKLSSKKYRYKLNKYKIENLAIIFDALKSGHVFEALFVTENFIQNYQEKMDYFQKNAEKSQLFVISGDLNKACSELETPSGIIAVYGMEEFGWKDAAPVIYLNGINDPGNLGTILRTALAFDFKNIILDEKCADIYNAKTLNAAKDAIFKLNIREDNGFEWLRENKGAVHIYAADSNGGEPLAEFKAEKPFVLVLGSESHGIDSNILEIAEERVKIEISEEMESLNVAVAGAIIMYGLRG